MKNNIFKLIGYSIFLIAISSFVTYLITSKKLLNFSKKKITSLLPVEKKTIFKPTVRPTSTPNFVVILNDVPVLNKGFNFEAVIENISVLPYITNMAFYECDFLDNNGKTYSGTLFNCQESFEEKALLPNEKAKVVFKNVTAELKGGGGVSYSGEGPLGNIPKCDYNDKGVKVCTTIEGLKIKSCKAYISNAKKQVSNGWGEHPIIVNFPL